MSEMLWSLLRVGIFVFCLLIISIVTSIHRERIFADEPRKHPGYVYSVSIITVGIITIHSLAILLMFSGHDYADIPAALLCLVDIGGAYWLFLSNNKSR